MNTKSVFYLLLWVVGWIYLINGCVPPYCPQEYLSAEAKNYFVAFKTGDYWIYKNVDNGDLDSVYLVSQKIVGNDPVIDGNCISEYAEVDFKGIDDKPFGYKVFSKDDRMSITNRSYIDFISNYDPNVLQTVQIQGTTYEKVRVLTHCCITGCYNDCAKPYFQFDRLYFAPYKGIVRYEVSNHPQFGKATYELIRTNIK